MSARAAEMAKIIMDEWASGYESAERFVLQRFPEDKINDLEVALKIVIELKTADWVYKSRS